MRVLTIGSFDGLHVGHLELLDESRRLASPDGVIVAVNSDDFITRYKGHAPTHPFQHRVEMLEALRAVDDVVPNYGDEDAREVIERVEPDLLTIGDDWLDPGHDEARYFAQLGVTPEWMSARGLRVEYIPRTRGVSSTTFREIERRGLACSNCGEPLAQHCSVHLIPCCPGKGVHPVLAAGT